MKNRISTSLLLAACMVSTGMAHGEARADTAPTTLLVGVVTLQHSANCKGPGGPDDEVWLDPHHQAGFVRLVPAAGVDLTGFDGKPAVLHGAVPTDFKNPAAGFTGPCQFRQSRNDWVWGKGGTVRILRNNQIGPSRPEAFRVERVEAFSGVGMKEAGKELVVTFRNDLGRPLPDLVLTMHYEGCYGKPGSRSRAFEAGTVAPNKTVTARFGKLFEDPPVKPASRSGNHAAYSVRVASAAPDVIFDLTLSVWRFGQIKVECPKRGGGKR